MIGLTMRIFGTKAFNRQFKSERVPKSKFEEALFEIQQGLSTSLGHKLFKKRIGSKGRGKSGAFRTIYYLRVQEMVIFLHLFPKNVKGNISRKEFKELILLAKDLDTLSDSKINKLVKIKELIKYF